tara:strand:- start:2375 stop:2950 length:576 start_codon:yes stop_codon:yes gene_type:complete
MDETNQLIKGRIEENIKVNQSLLDQVDVIEKLAIAMYECLDLGNKILIFGNGGSASDAQHIAGELVATLYERERRGLPAIALHTNGSTVTAIANDFGYESVFERQIEAFCSKGDVAIGISTSGESTNVIKALQLANDSGAITVGLTGSRESSILEICDMVIRVNSLDTPRIQEAHILIGHICCEIVEKKII